MTTTAIYCRISQDRSGEALGVARQEADCRALAESLGWDVVTVLTDNDLGASTKSRKARPSFERLAQMIESRDVEAVIAYSSSRLTRRPAELERVIGWAEQYGVRLATVSTGKADVDLSTSQGRIMARVLGAVDAGEAEQASERIVRKHRELAERGRPSGGGCRPFGFAADGIEHVEHEAAALRDVADAILNGESLTQAAKSMNDRGLVTTTGRCWTRDSLRRALTSPRMAGLRTHNGSLTPAVWQPIMDADTHERLCAALARSTGGTNARRHVWTGTVRCGKCGAAMIRKQAGARPRYSCPTPVGGRGCGSVAVSADPLDAMLTETLIAHVERIELEAEQESDPAAEHRVVVAELEERLASLADAFAVGSLDVSAFSAATSAVTQRLDSARADLRRASQRERLVSSLPDLRAAWPTMTLSAQRAVVETFVASVSIAPGVRGRNTFDPSRVALTWR